MSNDQPYDAELEAKLREAAAQGALAQQRKQVDSILAMKREQLHSPLGLASLFPTNKVRVKVTTKAQQRKAAEERLKSTPGVDTLYP